MSDNTKAPSIIDALIPVIALIGMLASSVILYGEDSSYGANQIALLVSAGIALIVGYKNGFTWKQMESGIVKGISMALGAILILMMVGSLIGTWILSGTVPTMIYYGLLILDPSIFYAAACIICALVAVSTGSSWTTAGTIGIALIGIAVGLNLSPAITAGAIISGAYFGDKMSPLSDTTNLAPAMTGTDLFTHIRHMAWTTGPSILIAIVLFAFIGFMGESGEQGDTLTQTLSAIDGHFNVSVLSLIPLFLVLFLAYKKMPAFPTLFVGALLGGLFAIIFQASSTEEFAGDSRLQCSVESTNLEIDKCKISDLSFDSQSVKGTINIDLMTIPKTSISSEVSLASEQDETDIRLEHSGESLTVNVYRRSYLVNAIDSVWRAMATGFESTSGNEDVDSLLSRGGMKSIITPTVWLILCAMVFGAVMETVGLLQRLVSSALTLVKGTGSLVLTVICTCIGVNIIAADQYMAIVLPGRMYRAEFKRRKLHPKNLSRVLEDSATITSPLIPWNTCGAFMAGTLGVSTFVYLPFCFFNLVNPIVSVIYGITQFKIEKIDQSDDSDENSESQSGEDSEAAVLNQG